MHTEDEAREKLCPHMSSGPMNDEHVRVSRCMASQCMAWRWSVSANGEYLYENLRANPRKQVGYCGLAGKDGQ